MILADTSAWVEFDRATGSRTDSRLTELIDTDADLGITEPILMEVLPGARTARREDELRRLLHRFALLRFDSVVDFEAAARNYRRCRAAGVTPRGMIDCMIAAVALRTGSALLCHDVDMRRIADVVGVDLDPLSGL